MIPGLCNNWFNFHVWKDSSYFSCLFCIFLFAVASFYNTFFLPSLYSFCVSHQYSSFSVTSLPGMHNLFLKQPFSVLSSNNQASSLCLDSTHIPYAVPFHKCFFVFHLLFFPAGSSPLSLSTSLLPLILFLPQPCPLSYLIMSLHLFSSFSPPCAREVASSLPTSSLLHVSCSSAPHQTFFFYKQFLFWSFTKENTSHTSV